MRSLVKHVMHHITNAHLQQVWNTNKVSNTVSNFDTMQAGDVCWWKQCFKEIFACVSVSATAKINILFLINCHGKLAMTLHTVAKSGVTIQKN